MVDQTKAGSIDGFFLDSLSYMHIKRHLSDKNFSKDVFNFFHSESKATEIEFPGDKKERSVYGILLKDRKDYDFFRFAFEDNKEEFDMCNRWGMGTVKSVKKEIKDIFSQYGGYIFPMFYTNLAFVVIDLCFVIVYEILLSYYKKKTKRQ